MKIISLLVCLLGFARSGFGAAAIPPPVVAPAAAFSFEKIAEIPPVYVRPVGVETFIKGAFFASVTGEAEAAFRSRHVGKGKPAPGNTCVCRTCQVVKTHCADMKTSVENVGGLRARSDEKGSRGNGTFNVIVGTFSNGNMWASQADPWRRFVDVAALQAAFADKTASAVFQVASRWNAEEGMRKHISHQAGGPGEALSEIAKHAVQGEEAAISGCLRAMSAMYFEPPRNMLSGFVNTTIRVGSGLADVQFELAVNETGGLQSATIIGLTDDHLVHKDFVNQFCRYFCPVFVDGVPVTGGFSNIDNDTNAANRPSHVHVAVRNADGMRVDPTKCISQAFVAGLDLSKRILADAVSKGLARLILHACYEGTLQAAHVHGKRRVFLTGVGTGAFHNDWAWVVDALERMQPFIVSTGLEVFLVCPAEPTIVASRLRNLVVQTKGSYLKFSTEGVHALTHGADDLARGAFIERARQLWGRLQTSVDRSLGMRGDLVVVGDSGGKKVKEREPAHDDLLEKLHAVRGRLEELSKRVEDLKLQLRGSARAGVPVVASRSVRGDVVDISTLLGTGQVFITLVQGDITKQIFADPSQAVSVNAANEAMLGGGGIDGAFHTAAGSMLRAECGKVPESSGRRCSTGQARLTWGHNLAPLRIIHTVGPRCGGLNSQTPLGANKAQLEAAYTNSLNLAASPQYLGWQQFWHDKKDGLSADSHYHGCTDRVPTNKPIVHIAFPTISTGIFGCNLKEAAAVAIDKTLEYLRAYPTSSIREVRFVLFGRDDFTVYLQELEKRGRESRGSFVAATAPDQLKLEESSRTPHEKPRCFVLIRGS